MEKAAPGAVKEYAKAQLKTPAATTRTTNETE